MGKSKKILLMKRTKVEKWLRKWGKRLNISMIERDLEIRNNRVQKFLKYNICLDDQTVLDLYEYFNKWSKNFCDLLE